MKLSNKLLLSYIGLLVMAFVIAMGISNQVVSNRLLNGARENLEEQAISIMTIIESSKFDLNQPRRIVTYMNNSQVGNLVPSDIFVLNQSKNIVYASNETYTRNVVQNIMTNNPADYVRVLRTIKDEETIVGYLLLISEVKHIEHYTVTLRRALIMGMLGALCIGIIVALLMGRSIVKPIISLKNDILLSKDDPEHEIKAINTGDELEDLYIAYSQMNTSINAHLDERKRFFQNASHELKTPLMSIQGYAEAIKDGVVEGREVEESLDIIINKSQELKTTVEEIIYLSKLVNDDFDYSYVVIDINQLVRSAVEDQRLIAKEHSVEILYIPSIESINCKVDPDKLAVVFENLISNAIRYAISIIKIEVKDLEKEVIIRVMDDGNGLDEGESTKVFERFYKGDGGKSGIGLAVVKEIVQHHGGTINAGNHISGGAVFELRMKRV